MRRFIFAMAIAGMDLCRAAGLQAADLDYRYRLPPKPPHEPGIYEAPYEHTYSRPVVGFYAYPNDHVVHGPREPSHYERLAPEPYILRRDAPHGIAD